MVSPALWLGSGSNSTKAFLPVCFFRGPLRLWHGKVYPKGPFATGLVFTVGGVLIGADKAVGGRGFLCSGVPNSGQFLTAFNRCSIATEIINPRFHAGRWVACWQSLISEVNPQDSFVTMPAASPFPKIDRRLYQKDRTRPSREEAFSGCSLLCHCLAWTIEIGILPHLPLHLLTFSLEVKECPTLTEVLPFDAALCPAE